ncbi:MAG: glucuronate isomerase [Verrucomicrobiales bacterium]
MSFIHDDFLLESEAAHDLYVGYAQGEPILDYHTHLPPDAIASNQGFATLFDIWLAGDHYKWRAMRANGIDEERITGSADPWDKFLAFAETVPHTLRNPLYHWVHLELKRYFGFDGLFGPDTAKDVWEAANAALATPAFRTQALLQSGNVRAVCTTDDPTDDLAHHRAIAAQAGFDTKVLPTFRPDWAMRLDEPDGWRAWVDKLEACAGQDCAALPGFVAALRGRHDFFHQSGCRLSDHGLVRTPALPCTEAEAAAIFGKARAGRDTSAEEREKFGAYLMLLFGEWNAERGWTMQFHVGPLRNNNFRLFEKLGRDIGCDSVGDDPQAASLGWLLGQLDARRALPKVIAYNINPGDNYPLATMLGNFQGGGVSRMQFGSGWWFLDTIEGMEWQLNTLSSTGLLSRFVGMLTDSRSFLSVPRHEYFRRVLCNLIGNDIERGHLPRDMDLVGGMVKRICYQNAADFLAI